MLVYTILVKCLQLRTERMSIPTVSFVHSDRNTLHKLLLVQ